MKPSKSSMTCCCEVGWEKEGWWGWGWVKPSESLSEWIDTGEEAWLFKSWLRIGSGEPSLSDYDDDMEMTWESEESGLFFFTDWLGFNGFGVITSVANLPVGI